MIRILLADDEKHIRKGLAKIIEKLGNDFCISGEAVNGEQALELIVHQCPDIVITDIRMPKLDGIKLVKILEEKYPEIKKVILSGFDEFNYAREALRTGAVDYLLKPVDEEQLLELLTKTAEKIKEEKESRLAEIKLKAKLSQSLPVLREIFLKELIADGKYQDGMEIGRKLKQYEVNICNESYNIIIVSVDNIKKICGPAGAENAEKLYRSIRNLAEESVSAYSDYCSFMADCGLVMVCGIPEIDDGLTDKICESIYNKLSGLSEVRFTISIGRAVRQPVSLKESFGLALQAQCHRFYSRKSSVISFEKLPNSFISCIPSGVAENFDNQLMYIYETLNLQKLKTVVTDFCSVLRDLWVKPADVLRVLEDTCNSLRINTPKFKQAVDEEYGEAFHFFGEVSCINSLDDILEYLISFYSSVLLRMIQITGRKDKKIIDVVKSYIQENYKHDISLGTLGGIAYVSPNHLSEVFKEQTGESVVDYITRVRIEKSKELLKDISIKVYEVSDLVGYEDSAYFSKVFKKVVGVSPVEYRNLVI